MKKEDNIIASEKRVIAAIQKTQERDYWLEKLSGELPFTSFPKDYKQDPVQPDVQTIEMKLSSGLNTRLLALSKGSDPRLHMVLLSGVMALISRYLGMKDIILGVPVYKQKTEAEYLNRLLAIRQPVGEMMTFRELLVQVRQTLLEALDHRNYPIELLIQLLLNPGTNQEGALFDTLVLLENIHPKNIENPDNMHIHMKFVFKRRDQHIQGSIEYNARMYGEEKVRKISTHLQQLLKEILEDVNARISLQEIVTEEEKQQILQEFNHQDVLYPDTKTIHQIFREQVQKVQDHTAVVYDAQHCTYASLDTDSQYLAGTLKRKGVRRGTIIAIMIEPSIKMIQGMMGILKAGAAYLPIDIDSPGKRVHAILEDCAVSLLLAGNRLEGHSFTSLLSLQNSFRKIEETLPRPQIQEFDKLPFVDRSLVPYNQYNQYIGQAMVSHSIAIQATRGCPFDCLYCHRIWPRKHVYRKAEHLIQEVSLYYEMGVRRFVIIDDIFNFNRKNIEQFFKAIIKKNMNIQLFFPNGLRGDLLTPEIIDLMVAAGTKGLALALETASPRLQKLIRKNLNLEKLEQNLQYFCENYPQVILELFTMHGFPTETKEEARMTLDFITRQKWLHFPYLHILKIYPNTAMEKLALEKGITRETILESMDLAYHEIPGTLPFDKEFTRNFQAEFLQDYFLSRERILEVLPRQMAVLTEDELIQKYDSYLPQRITHPQELFAALGIKKKDIGHQEFLNKETLQVSDWDPQIQTLFPKKEKAKGALKLLLMDLSQFFSHESDMLYDVVEPPLGLMALATYINEHMGEQVQARIVKSRIDFDHYSQLRVLLEDYQPEVLGIRTLSLYKDFFHKTVTLIRQWGFKGPIVSGGPYATSAYNTLLQDPNVDLVVLGEGEVTFKEVLEKILNNDRKMPSQEELLEVKGLAFASRQPHTLTRTREILLSDQLIRSNVIQEENQSEELNHPEDLAYIIYTSGSTGKPKGVMIEHKNVVRLMFNDEHPFDFSQKHIWTMFHSYCFDFSVWEMYGALLYGGKLIMASGMVSRDTKRFLELLGREKITVLNQTPSAFYNLMEQEEIYDNTPGTGIGLRYVIFGGEALHPSRLDKWKQRHPETKLVNMYGITETTVHVTYKEIREKEIQQGISDIGKPIPTLNTYIVDRNLFLLPTGVTGELVVGGKGVGRGYLNRPELTEERFRPDPYKPGEGIYRSGDLGRYQENGDIEYMGRQDLQVKIRGYRVELGEIETQLRMHHQIKEAIVMMRELGTGNRDNGNENKYLCAYIVPGGEIDEQEVKRNLSLRLPDYMVPSYIIPLKELPLTENKKIDRKRLPLPGKAGGKSTDYIYMLPSNAIEKRLVEIWQEVLKTGQVGIRDNFFNLGGHSLNATKVLARIFQEFHVNIELREFFAYPIISEMAELISQSEKVNRTAMQPREEKEYYRLSYAQRRLWVACHLAEDFKAYNEPGAFRISGEFDAPAFERAIQTVMERHESLRTAFIQVDGEPRQKVERNLRFIMEEIDLTDSDPEKTEKQAKEIYIQAANKVFDLEKAPLFLAKLVKLEKEQYVLIANMHHLLGDGWSGGILENEVTELYNHYKEGRKDPFPRLKYQYKDYTHWNNTLIEEDYYQQSQEYWLEKFKDKPKGIELPLDLPRGPIQTFNGGRVQFFVGQEKTRQLHELGAAQGATLFMGLLSMISIYLYRITGEKDMIIASPIAGRNQPELNSMIGFLANTLVFRNQVNPNESFSQLLKRVKQETLESYENQNYPFDLLVEKLGLERELSQSPLFNVMLAHNNTETLDTEQSMEGLAFSGYTQAEHITISKFDLLMVMDEVQGRISGYIEYNSDLFNRNTIERMANNLHCLLENILNADPLTPIYELNTVQEAELEKILLRFNTSEKTFPAITLQQMFENQVTGLPGAEALNWKNQSITFQELNKRANQIAHYLRKEYQVCPNEVMGVQLERSMEMIVLILGIIKSGAGYVAIDPNYPKEQVQHILSDSGTQLVVMDKIRTTFLEKYKGQVLQYASASEATYLRDLSIENPAIINHQDDILYTIYTSGSTGTPNGAMLSHGLLTNLIQWQKQDTTIDNSLNCVQFTSINFCVSFQEILGTLTSGGELHLVGELERQDIDFLIEFLITHKIGVLHLPFSYLNFLFNESSRWGKNFGHSLRHIITAGEQLKISTGLKKFLELNPCLQLHNHYGSSEMHVVTSFTLDATMAEQEAIPPAGKPISNTRIYILDNYLKPVPIGAWGEITVLGSTPVSGYINNPELTGITQVKPDFLKGYDQFLYRTGDIGRWKEDGNIEYKGRKDQQLKIRGFRVEPGEIESKILSINLVEECVVVDKQDDRGQKYLAAFLVIKGIELSTVRKKLQEQLPQYMIPRFMKLDKLPLMPNGKVDREQLPEPEIHLGKEYVAPRDDTEGILVRLWSDILSLKEDQISIEASFFELGGHSLKATTLVSRIHKECDVKIKLTEVFKSPTIKELAECIRESSREFYSSIHSNEKREYYPVSSAQYRIYILQQLGQDNTNYNEQMVLDMQGVSEFHKITRTFETLIHRHETLRTSFELINEEPVQRIHDETPFDIPLHEQDTTPVEQKIKAFIRPFDLEKAPLLRVGLIKTGEKTCILMMDMHHIITDGVSIQILSTEFISLYQEKSLPELRLQYKDYSQWQHSESVKGIMKKQQEYWLSLYPGEIPVLTLPTDFQRPTVKQFDGDRIPFEIDEENTRAIRRKQKDDTTTMHILFLAIFNILLSKLSGQRDIIIGTPIAGRRHTDLEQVIGMFVNTLPLRNKPQGAKRIDDYLNEIRENTLEAYENQDYQFEELVEELGVKRDMSRNPLFDVMYSFQTIELPIQGQATGKSLELQSRPYHHVNHIAKFDLSLNGAESGNRLAFTFDYSTRLFQRETLLRFIGNFKRIVSFLGENPLGKISEIEIISPEEKILILEQFNGTSTNYPKEKTIHQLFREQADTEPEKIALQYEGECVTYKGLDNRTDQLATKLFKKSVSREIIVGILAERTPDMIVGIMAILKIGGLYLPIDPKYPVERITYILHESGTEVLLATAESLYPLQEETFKGTLLNLSDPELYLYQEHEHSKGVSMDGLSHATDASYMIYTSGSSGKPKGVVVSHQNVIRLVRNTNYIDISPYDRFIMTGALVFDISTFEIWSTLLNRAQLCLIPDSKVFDVDELEKEIIKNKITIIHFIPQLLNQAITQNISILSGVRTMLVGGDLVNPQHVGTVREHYPNLEILHMYGPTENTTFSSSYKVGKDIQGKLSIGKPISNSKVIILDANDKIQPIGVVGELCVIGDGVSRGYLNQVELTNNNFFLHPDLPGEPIYRTGDLARWFSDGNIEFLGRKDRQVKLRGIRIELGEIENLLQRHEKIKEVVVVAQADHTGNHSTLGAYILLNTSSQSPETEPLKVSQLREYLLERLPEYMVPSFFKILKKFPLTHNKKIDIKALDLLGENMGTGIEYVAPRSKMERQVTEVWKEVLGVEKVGVNDNIFDVGGNSLKIIQIRNRLRKIFERDINIVLLFRYPTIRQLVTHFEEKEKKDIISEEEIEESIDKMENAMDFFLGK
jgi:amino acid adenylation domain-containing protein